jgi:hypothetical protein
VGVGAGGVGGGGVGVSGVGGRRGRPCSSLVMSVAVPARHEAAGECISPRSIHEACGGGSIHVTWDTTAHSVPHATMRRECTDAMESDWQVRSRDHSTSSTHGAHTVREKNAWVQLGGGDCVRSVGMHRGEGVHSVRAAHAEGGRAL